MSNEHLNKTISEILKSKYIVPLYQRNYAWEQPEISLLLQDIYESFLKDSNSNYYIGSLIVLQRKNGDYEVIDGQQRLTTITLIAKILGNSSLQSSSLYYDSRPEVERFFDALYKYNSILDIPRQEKIAHFYDAIGFIQDTNLNPDSDTEIKMSGLDENLLKHFRDYFFNQVVLVRVEIPEDTDVAKYFEIMNNRGEQLQKHEVLKARLLSELIGDSESQRVFARLWDACSQMDIQIQRLFHFPERETLFGEDFEGFKFDHKKYLEKKQTRIPELSWTIAEILSNNDHQRQLDDGDNLKKIEDDADGNAIIDFSNFLMHVLKLEYNRLYLSRTERDIPLNEKYLLDVYHVIKDQIDSMYFIERALYYRTVMDRVVVRSLKKADSEDNYEWTLRRPERYHNKTENTYHLNYRNSYFEQERLIKSLSLLQVTFPARIYKNWLQSLLSWFSGSEKLKISKEHLQTKIDLWMLEYYTNHKILKNIKDMSLYSEGTATPHFLFNFIDYLYFVDKPTEHARFSFRYRNSVEHHRSQSRPGNVSEEVIHCLGNLCLVSKSLNSKMNNDEPITKARNYKSEVITPKRKAMYEQTNQSNSQDKWTEEEIMLHYHEIIELINKKEQLLSLNQQN